MSDLFEDKNIKPMLIGVEGEPFDDSGFIYELKIDGERCIAYLDPDSGTDLRNKRNVRMLPKVPELSELHKNVNRRCILDGELAIITDGKPDFYSIQRRSLMTGSKKIELEAKQHPATLIAFDILYSENRQVTHLPLMERKKLLSDAVINENARFAVSRVVESGGTDFFELVKAQELEGIVAKRRDSRYYFDRRTKDWIKIKYLKDDDFIVCGYIRKDKNMTSIVLGQYENGILVCKGHVTLGVSGESLQRIRKLPTIPNPEFDVPPGNENAVWVEPRCTCTVQYMNKTEKGGMRQPVFKGLRLDK